MHFTLVIVQYSYIYYDVVKIILTPRVVLMNSVLWTEMKVDFYNDTPGL